MCELFCFQNVVFQRFKSALVIIEHSNDKLASSSLKTVAAASQLGDVTCLVVGHQCSKVIMLLAS